MYIQDFVGKLESEDIVLCDIGGNQDYWYRTADPSRRRGKSNDSDIDGIILQKPVKNEREVVEEAVRTQNLDFMIRDPTMPVPDSEWVSREPYQSNQLTHASLRPETVAFTHETRAQNCQHFHPRQ